MQKISINMLKAFRQAQMEGAKIKDTWPNVLKRMAKENKEKITVESVAKKSAPLKKSASILSKLYRAFPKSNTLDKAVTNQMAKATRAGKGSKTIRKDYNAVKGDKIKEVSQPKPETSIVLSGNKLPAKINSKGSNLPIKRDSTALIKSQQGNIARLNYAPNPGRKSYNWKPLAAVGATGLAGGYALGSTNE